MQLEAGGIRRAIAFSMASAGPSSQEGSSRLGRPRYSFARKGAAKKWRSGAAPGLSLFETAPPVEHVTRAPRKQSPARRRTGAQAAIRSGTFGARWRRGPRSLFVRGRLVDPWEPRGADQRCDSCAARNLGRGEVPARTRSAGTNRSSDTISTSSSTRSRLLAPTTHRTASAPARHQRQRWRQSHAAISRVLARWEH